MAFKPFERSKKDVEVKGKGKEGSKKEEAFDRFQAKGKPTPKPFTKGGAVKKGARGC